MKYVAMLACALLPCALAGCGLLLGDLGVTLGDAGADGEPQGDEGGPGAADGAQRDAVSDDDAGDGPLTDAGDPDAQAPKIVFVTSTDYSGNLGSLGGADGKCQNLATFAGLQGTFQAWLSQAGSVVASNFVASSGPYVLVDGTPIAADWAGLTSGTLLHGITLSEQRTDRSGVGVWTGTNTSGLRYGEDCDHWRTDVDVFNGIAYNGGEGYSAASDYTWTQFRPSLPCSNRRALYCFQR
jgi:hypothetical protein